MFTYDRVKAAKFTKTDSHNEYTFDTFTRTIDTVHFDNCMNAHEIRVPKETRTTDPLIKEEIHLKMYIFRNLTLPRPF